MSIRDDEFDLDVRLMGSADVTPEIAPNGYHPGLYAETPTFSPAATCNPNESGGIDCHDTFGCFTHGCDTSETCLNPACGSDAITFGSYCIDDSGGDDTCHACPGGGGGEVETSPPCDTAPPCA